MNILFLLKNISVGGVEVVTSVLANKFVEENHHVVIWAFYKGEVTSDDRLDNRIKIVYGSGFTASKENAESLLNTLRDNRIDVVINQWALPPQTTSLLKKVLKQYYVRIISVHHSDPMTNGRLQNIDTALLNTQNPIIHKALKLKRKLYKMITSYSMRRSYQTCDEFVVLADSYKKHLTDFIGIESPNHLVSIANPITIDKNEQLSLNDKEKRLLYVGRLENENKKPERALIIWENLSKQFQDWQLDIVGDGPDRARLEKWVSEHCLPQVNFYGYQKPSSFYQRASMLLLTSDFEGFPLVLTEAMSFGVIPVAYGSFSAVYDIIEDGKDGLIIPKTKEGFNAAVMAERMAAVMTDKCRLEQMALAAIGKSKNYSIDKIYQQWMGVMKRIQLNSAEHN